jgi:uncharacterized protein YbjT (DUF2867 family)
VHFSALGAAADAPSRRLRTKAAGEELVRSELGDIATIFRPAPVVGTEDRLINAVAGPAKRLPFIPLINGGATRLQPIWVRDVANGEWRGAVAAATAPRPAKLCQTLPCRLPAHLVFFEGRSLGRGASQPAWLPGM